MTVAGGLRHRDLPLSDWSTSLSAVARMPKAFTRDVEAAIDLARRFNEEVVRPLTLALDERVQTDPEYLPHEFIAEANRWGLYTKWLPKMFGGGGWSFLSLNAFVEEVSSVCVGLANVVGVHYLGVAVLSASWNLKLCQRVYRDVVDGERNDRPCIIALAITEPGAGSDAEEVELADRGNAGCSATPQPGGGYLVNGRKVFISNGHVASWHMMVTCEDRRRIPDTATVLAVRAGAAGFRFGAHENKMGQKACVASELVFDDCFVPEDQVAWSRRMTAGMKQSHREATQIVLDYVVSATRAGVGAFAAGVAAGAYHEARDYALAKRLPDGSRFAELQWVQTALADMAHNALLARLSYLESAYANTLAGLYAALSGAPLLQLEQRMPTRMLQWFAARPLRWDLTTRLFQTQMVSRYPRHSQQLTSGLGSFAKFACSDLAVKNAHLAMDLLGADGLRHDHGVEKRLRDAKLLQIYEGTNQINRVNLFKCRIRPDETVRVFVRADDPAEARRDVA